MLAAGLVRSDPALQYLEPGPLQLRLDPCWLIVREKAPPAAAGDPALALTLLEGQEEHASRRV
jgi:hypothetical protein